MPKNAEYFYCKLCDFNTSKNSNWNKHLSTRKHQLLTNVDKKFICDCGKQFTARQSLSRHKKTCNYQGQEETLTTNNEPNLSNMITPEVVMKLLSQNQEFKEIIIEQQKENQRQQEEKPKTTRREPKATS